jgi:hypothetical protein
MGGGFVKLSGVYSPCRGGDRLFSSEIGKDGVLACTKEKRLFAESHGSAVAG